ncbi:dihydropteroate synthase [Ascidiimonas sp. W6]|uniref:dihydropteroate synthase n=1 Tax=Ascidiimonas meishanensis TaxID=3128903 RepID=UPI0030ED893E
MNINCKGTLIDLTEPKVMGILNVTPDSFFDGGRFQDEKAILKQVKLLIEEGANFIDIGGYSSRPGAPDISEKEELQRVLPVFEMLSVEFPDVLLSIDTFRSEIAGACIDAGAAIVNDITAGKVDENIFSVVAEKNTPYVMMHMQGNPKTMQQQPNYDNIVQEILLFFSERIAKARSFGINDIILDPGFGFGKTIAHNYELLSKLALFKFNELPLLIGVSRKSMIWKVLDISANEALNGTSVLHTIALQKGAQILRVHDVKEAKECVKLITQLKKHL